MNPIRLEPGALVAAPWTRDRKTVTSWRLARIYAVRLPIVLVECEAAPGVWRPHCFDAPSDGRRVGAPFTADELRPVADEPAALEELRRLCSRRPCPALVAPAILAHAIEVAFTWAWNGWPEHAAAHGLEVAHPPAPDASDLWRLYRLAGGRGPFAPFAPELSALRRLFLREYPKALAARGAA